MRDKPTIQRVALLHPAIRTEVGSIIDEIESTKFNPYMAIRIVQGLRTYAEQDALYAKGRTTPGKRVTNARGGQSYHNFGLAIDFAILYDKDKNGTFETLSWDLVADLDRDGEKDWQEVVDSFMHHGYDWGGLWNGTLVDNPHFEKTFNLNWREMGRRYTLGNFIKETHYIVI